MKAINDPQAHSFAFIDDFTILVYTDTHEENMDILRDIIREVNLTAAKLGLEFELPKTELINFITPRKIGSNPSLTIPHSGNTLVIHPADTIRWLGFYLDRKLTFEEHIRNMANRAKAVVAGLGMLANTVRGLSLAHARLLFKGAVLPILTYGSCLWFLGHRQLSLTKPLVKVQNQGIRWLLGALRTTPIHPMEHLASIPPLHVHLAKLSAKAAAKLKSIPTKSELYTRLPKHWLPPGSKRNAPALVSKSPIHTLASQADPNMESVTPYTTMPYDKPPEFISTISTISGDKEARVEKAINLTSAAIKNPRSIVCFTDGHMSNSSAVGYVVYQGTNRLITHSRNIGSKASIYDAEMWAIALACEKATAIAPELRKEDVVIFSDNSAAVNAINDISRHPAQEASLAFRKAAYAHNAAFPDGTIRIQWIPGHSGIEGNEAADQAAKEGGQLAAHPSSHTTITWLKTQATTSATASWIKIWNKHIIDRPESDRFIPNPPSLKLNQVFHWRTPRDLSSRLVHVLTGHGHFTSYRAKFRSNTLYQCICGEHSPSIIHETLLCPKQEDNRQVLRECSSDLKEQVLFGSTAGLKAMMKFIATSGIGSLRRISRPEETAQ